MGDGDKTGQFITFTFKGCYETDKNGHGSNEDFHKYNGLSADKKTHIYEGNSYWGKAYYYFGTDFNRLNVRAADGVIYVYQKTAAPKDAVASTYTMVKKAEEQRLAEQKKEEQRRGEERREVVILPPIDNRQIQPVQPVDNTWEIKPRAKTKCSVCNGSGLCKSCNGTGKGSIEYIDQPSYTGSYTRIREWCNDCGRSDYRHRHQICGVCRGSKKCQACNGNGEI